jgi:hypothetical protein
MGTKTATPKKIFLGFESQWIVSLAQKQSVIQERRQDQSCLFRRGDYKNKGNNEESPSLVQVLVKTVSLAR